MVHDTGTRMVGPKAGRGSESLPTDAEGLTVYFDGSCPLCSAEVAHYAAQRGGDTLAFVDVSKEDSAIGADLAPGDAMRRFHVRRADGRLLSGARAFIAIWETLPRWCWAARIAAVPGMPYMLEGAYRLFLPIRPVLSKLASVLGARPANSCPRDDGAERPW
ncbi:thiol-disulfide oxidoreductase DCC family protein [Pseudooceanicola lipolyticus]|nr:DUF393 domain-containing protein [Pseudooceanicola lipolyticus]